MLGRATKLLATPHLLERLSLRLRGYVTLREAGVFTAGDLKGRKVGIGLEVDIGLVMHDPAPGPGTWHLASERSPLGIGCQIPHAEYGDWYVRAGAAVVALVKRHREQKRFAAAAWP